MRNDPNNPFEQSERDQVPPEILDWARQTFDLEDFMKDVRAIEAGGGKELHEFIGEIEARLRSS